MRHWRLLALLPALLLLGAGPALRPTAHITSQTTTTLVAAVAGKSVQLMAGSICIDANGAATGITIQSSAGTNLIGTNVVYVLAPGACLWFPRSNSPYGNVTASGTGLAIATTVGSGPVEVYLEVIQQ